ncbi:hypothetical protein GCK72_019878 [Caenorhabditis remanei]|uniref:Uncharacterized protein n=1 Tax=Caenorhabditis remanei TaxID=31234 RepID=A0A6A5GFR0_CAERE|nr:hypothetical protein GCK72_019878 [Caenorhabditis remanei]KAF1753322.1 hypothetical protein GCK72_019878 [Caenorhabditis remanei]
MDQFGRHPSCLRKEETCKSIQIDRIGRLHRLFPGSRSIEGTFRSEKSDQKSVSFVGAPNFDVNRPWASEIVNSSKNEHKYLEKTTIRIDRMPMEVMIRAYAFASRNRVWSTWILVEVESCREHSVRAFELNGGFFLQKTPEALGTRIPRDMSPLDRWVAYHVAILDYVDVNAPRPRYSTSRLSSLSLIRENDMNCGCLPSLLSQHEAFGLSDFCQIRQIAQKAMLLHKTMSAANTTDDQERVNNQVPRNQLPPIALIQCPPISEQRINELLEIGKEPSPAPPVFGLGLHSVEPGTDAEKELLDYGESSGEDNHILDEAGKSYSNEDDLPPPNEQVLFGPPAFYVDVNSNADDVDPSQDSSDKDQDVHPVSASGDETDGKTSETVAQLLDTTQESETIPMIFAMLKKISDQLETISTASVTHDDLGKYVTKKDLEVLATKTDLEALAKKTDLTDRIPSLDQWTDMIERLAPIATLQGISKNMGIFLEQLTRIAIDQRRLSRSQGKGNEKVELLLKQGSLDRKKFEQTSLKITRVYDSLRSYIARKVSSMETATEVRDLKIQMAGIKKDQDSFKQILEPGADHDDSVLIALDEIEAIGTTSERAHNRKVAEIEERKLHEARKTSSTICFYCRGAHDAAQCDVHLDLQSKRLALITQQRCLICGKNDCDGSPELCKAKHRLCVRCDPSMPSKEREHHPLLCPSRHQKHPSSSAGETSKVGNRSESDPKDDSPYYGANMDKYLDPSRPRQEGRYHVQRKYVDFKENGFFSDSGSDEEKKPSTSQRALAPSSSKRSGGEPSKKYGGHNWQRRGAKHRSSGKRDDAKRPRLAPAAKSESSIKKEPETAD